MKYLIALLKGEEIPRHSREEEPTKPMKPVLSVLSGAHSRSTREIGQAHEPDYRSLYQQMAEAVQDDCFLIDACWLIDRHPELWKQIRALDNELTDLEQTGAGEPVYQAALSRLCACLREVRALYERERERSVQ